MDFRSARFISLVVALCLFSAVLFISKSENSFFTDVGLTARHWLHTASSTWLGPAISGSSTWLGPANSVSGTFHGDFVNQPSSKNFLVDGDVGQYSAADADKAIARSSGKGPNGISEPVLPFDDAILYKKKTSWRMVGIQKSGTSTMHGKYLFVLLHHYYVDWRNAAGKFVFQGEKEKGDLEGTIHQVKAPKCASVLHAGADINALSLCPSFDHVGNGRHRVGQWHGFNRTAALWRRFFAAHNMSVAVSSFRDPRQVSVSWYYYLGRRHVPSMHDILYQIAAHVALASVKTWYLDIHRMKTNCRDELGKFLEHLHFAHVDSDIAAACAYKSESLSKKRTHPGWMTTISPQMLRDSSCMLSWLLPDTLRHRIDWWAWLNDTRRTKVERLECTNAEARRLLQFYDNGRQLSPFVIEMHPISNKSRGTF